MKGLLSNALYSHHYNPWKPQELSSWEKLQHVLDGLLQDKNPAPLVGTATGLMAGGLLVFLFFTTWYKCLQHRRSTSLSKDGREYFHALSLMSRPTSDDSQYQRRQKQKASWWARFMWYTSQSSGAKLTIAGPACYLLYEPNESSGQLVKYYSKTPLNLEGDEHRQIVAVWKPASHISSHKYTQNAGRSVLIGNCTVGFQGRHNYCNAFCQFIKSAFANGGGTITLLQEQRGSGTETSSAVALSTDVYLYLNDTRPQYQTVMFQPGKTRTIPSNTQAVACLPHKTPFYSKKIVDMYKWLADAERQGSSIRF